MLYCVKAVINRHVNILSHALEEDLFHFSNTSFFFFLIFKWTEKSESSETVSDAEGIV